MPKYLQVNIPESCHKSWNEMLPNNKGRHCLSCQKTVVDFTNMTDAQLISFFTKNTGNTCGRFSNDQLQRDILIPKKKVNWMKYFFQFALPAFLLSIKPATKVFAQKQRIQASIEPIKKVNTDSSPEIITPKDTVHAAPQVNNGVEQMLIGRLGGVSISRTAYKKDISLSGKVVDEKNNPISFASIIIKGTKKGAAPTDSGTFKLKDLVPTSMLIVSHVGYATKEISCKNLLMQPTVQLEQAQSPIGDVLVVGGYVSVSKHKKKKEAAAQPQMEIAYSAKIYPNPIPSSGILNISWTNAEAGSYSIQITNLQGQVVQVEKLELEKKQAVSSISLKSIITGTYAVIITNTKTGKHFSNQLLIQ